MGDSVSESDLIAILSRFIRVRRDDVVQGIGDDAALVRPPADRQLAMATDTLVSGIHFPDDTAPEDVGWKALAVNLSDLAAMGAEPAWALLSLTLPEPDREWVSGFAAGFAELAGEYDVALVGGDTGGGPLAVTVQVTGFVAPGRALVRDGAKVGDHVYVTGTLGDAAAGLALVKGHREPTPNSATLRARLDRPRPRVAAGQRLAGVASACIDLSDGLATDLARVLEASGCGAVVELDQLPASRALADTVPDAGARRTLQLAGDDYELCFTAEPSHHREIMELADELELRITRVGEILEQPGLVYTDDGEPAEAPDAGWRHFLGDRRE